MKKLILGLSVIGTAFFFFTPTQTAKASGNYQIETIKCEGGGTVYRCRFDGSESCDVSGQKHCSEVGGIG